MAILAARVKDASIISRGATDGAIPSLGVYTQEDSLDAGRLNIFVIYGCIYRLLKTGFFFFEE